MRLIKRGFIRVRTLTPFVEWANINDEDGGEMVHYSTESNIYLIEEDEDLFAPELIIKKNFKKIFLSELDFVTEDESCYPEIKLDIFNQWFETEVGDLVFDCLNTELV